MDRKQLTPELEKLGLFFNEFNKESDRGAVLLAASMLDESLLEILESWLISNNSAKELILGFNAPLGTFSARLKASHALGLIMDHEFNEIDLIRKIRNEFGHGWKDISFESPKIKKSLDKLPWLGPDDVIKSPKSKFSFAVSIILVDLLYRARLVRKERLSPRIWGHRAR
ncbi:MltR family transcriptional regulator [Pectobacterium versatile]|uniref:MltR family transcriptional regulator n=1 Tax=Pectobacterium versatile TaxID=2488639 RepID=UPI001F1985D9|nr:MltR family transcriptional regulator [Pectobacterium versatile]